MTLGIPPDLLVAFLLVMTRTLAVFTVAPPFSGGLIPVRVRLALASALALLVAPLHTEGVPLDFGPLVVAMGYQVVVGALFGYVVQLLLSAPTVAGALVDNLAALSAASLFDPLTNASGTPVARLNQILATVVLVGLEGHLLMVRGILRSYEAAPLGGLRVESVDDVLYEGVGQLLLAALEISLPLVVALLLAETVLALAARAAPRLNVMVVGFAVKSVVLLAVLALTIPLLVNGVVTLLDRALGWAIGLSGG